MSQLLYSLLSDKLDGIAALYKVRPRITLIVRMPGKPDECAYLSDDNWADVLATVAHLNRDSRTFRAGPDEPPAETAPDTTAAACRLHWGTGAGLRAEGKP